MDFIHFVSVHVTSLTYCTPLIMLTQARWSIGFDLWKSRALTKLLDVDMTDLQGTMSCDECRIVTV